MGTEQLDHNKETEENGMQISKNLVERLEARNDELLLANELDMDELP